jgi:hypothetical protein
MWTWLSYDKTPLILGVLIAALAMLSVFLPKVGETKRFEKALSISIAVLSVLLLFAQDKTSDLATEKADNKLKTALAQQRQQLTGAFTTGTNQVIKATCETANQTRRSAKQQTDAIRQQAKQQTDEIKQQAAQHYTQLQTTMIGTSACPEVVIGNSTGGRPNQIAVTNSDQTLNMYDVRVELTEMAPSDPGKFGSPWTSVLHYQVITFPQVVPHWALSEPVAFYSKMTDIWVSFRVTTRATNCSGQIFLFDIGKNQWRTYTSILYRGDKPISSYYRPLSPGLQKSKPDPDSQ